MGQLPANRSVVFCSLLGYLLAHILVDGRLWVEGFILTLSSGLAVPLGVLFGLPAAVGLAAGVLVKDSLRMVVSVETVVYSLWLFVLSSAASIAWQRRFRPQRVDLTQRGWWQGFAGVVITAVTTAAAVFAWASELLGFAPFYLAFGTAVLSALGGTLFFTPITIFPVARSRLSSRLESAPAATVDVSGWRRTVLRVGPFCWAVCGLVWSVGFQLRQRVPLAGFERLNLELVYYWIHPAVFGRGGRRLQVVFGAVMLALLVFSLQQSTHTQYG